MRSAGPSTAHGKRSSAPKLAVFAAAAVIVALVAAAVAFNLFIGWKVNADAVADLTYTLGMDSETEPTGRTPNYLLLDSSYTIDASELWWAGKDEEKLAAWFAKHPKEYVVQHVTLNDWSCYAALVPSDDLEGPHHGSTTPSGEPGYFIFYIDTTSEQSLISTVNMAFVTIAIVGAFMAGAAGYLAGKRIDTAQEAQKRFYENMSFKEIADKLNISINTALGRMRYAIINMRAIAQERHIALYAE